MGVEPRPLVCLTLAVPVCLVGVEGAAPVLEAVDPVGDNGTFRSCASIAKYGNKVVGAEEYLER